MNVSQLMSGLVLVSVFTCGAARADDWPQWLGPRRDSVWREDGIVEQFPPAGPTVRWRAPVGGGFSGPAVADGRVYVTDRILPAGKSNPDNPFDRGSIAGAERLLCLSARDGSVLWVDEHPCTYTISYAAGPRSTPLVQDGKVYTVGAQGDVRCLDAATGKLAWSGRLTGDGSETPMWGFSGSPLIEGDTLICMGSGDVAVAFDRNSGKVLWKALKSKEPGYSSPVMLTSGGTRQLVIFYPQAVASLDPATGKVYWSEPFTSKMGLSVATPRCEGDLLFATSFYDGSLMLRLDRDKPAATKLWQKKGKNEAHEDVLHAMLCTPFLRDGYIYGVSSYGQLRCLKADTGEKIWETFAATSGDAGQVRWSNAFIVANGDRFFLANEQGDLIIAAMIPAGYHEISRAHLIEPTNKDPGRLVVWSHPAFANRCVYLRNDKELVCAILGVEK